MNIYKQTNESLMFNYLILLVSNKLQMLCLMKVVFK